MEGALEWFEGVLELAIEVLPMLNLVLPPKLGVLARMVAALRALRENRGPIGKTLAATMPAFCSRLDLMISPITCQVPGLDMNSHPHETRDKCIVRIHTQAANLGRLVRSHCVQNSHAVELVS